MDRPTVIPEPLWHSATPELQALIGALVEQNAALQQRVTDLEARLNLNSTNSSRLPSSDPASIKRAPPRKPTGKKRGGQPGHERHQRAMVPPDQVEAVVDHLPESCRRCGGGLDGRDSEPRRHQVAEVPPFRPVVTEHLALVSVSRASKPDVVRHLIGLGVDVNARDRRRWTPLHFAARAKNPEVVRLLIDAGADVNATNDVGITPLHESLIGYPADLELTEMLLAAGTKTDAIRKYMATIESPDKGAILDMLARYDSRGLIDETERDQ